jgi:hypothetical protein
MILCVWYIFAVWHEYNHTRRRAWNSRLQHFTVYAMSLFSLGRFEFIEDAAPQMNKKSEADKIMRHNKSQLFRLIRNYLFLEITEGSTADLGKIELYWPIKTPLLTILQNGATAFEKIYRINYALYRAEYLYFHNEVRKNKNR